MNILEVNEVNKEEKKIGFSLVPDPEIEGYFREQCYTPEGVLVLGRLLDSKGRERHPVETSHWSLIALTD